VIEPPCTQVAPDDPVVAEFVRGAVELWQHGPRDDPEAFLRAFLHAVGSTFQPPSPLPPELLCGARILIAERVPWEAEIPLERLADAAFPTLVVSGGHHRALDRICEALVRDLGAEHSILPGYGHAAQRHPGFNEVLADFVIRAAASARHR
jgi:pimeloyl-ACP methyl ester carboxylesterase